MKKRRRCSSVLVGIFAVALACLQPAAARGAVEGSFERTLKVSGPVDLDVNTGSGDIEVRSGAVGSVQVTGHIRVGHWTDNAEEKVHRIVSNPPIEQSGNSIRVGYIHDPELTHNISISYRVVVPEATHLNSRTGSGNQTVEGIRGPVEAHAGSGDMRLSNIGGAAQTYTGSGNMRLEQIKGDVRAHSGSGDIEAGGIAGAFQADAGSGNIRLEQTATGEVHARTGSGDVELRGVSSLVNAHTGSGNVQVQGMPKGEWKLNAGSGNVSVSVPANAAFDLDVATSSGTISLNHPVTVSGTITRRAVRGKVGTGGNLVEVRTSSGDVDID
jgi:DUF4097 and DUF4098 domain-containing protein YvlB